MVEQEESLIDFKVNDYIDVVLEQFFSTCARTLDTRDFVPGKISDKLLKFIYRKTAKRQLRSARLFWSKDKTALKALIAADKFASSVFSAAPTKSSSAAASSEHTDVPLSEPTKEAASDPIQFKEPPAASAAPSPEPAEPPPAPGKETAAADSITVKNAASWDLDLGEPKKEKSQTMPRKR